MGSDSSIPTGFWNHHLIDSGFVSSIVIVTDYHYPLTKKWFEKLLVDMPIMMNQ
jgi:hypothetical protein